LLQCIKLIFGYTFAFFIVLIFASTFIMNITNPKFNFHNPLLYALVISIGMFLGYKMKGTLLYNDNANASTGVVDEIMGLVKQRYVDSVGTDSVEMKAVDNLLSQLDPHSIYIPPSQLKGVDEDMDGEFDGIGVEYFMQKDTLQITSVIAGGPSADAGIETGDKFITVNDSIIAGKKINTDEIVKYLRGRKGSKVHIGVMRNKKILKDITITRGTIPMYSVDAAYLLSPTVGYIKINRFSATTYKEFLAKLQELKKLGLQKLVLDLRDNPGGYLETAVQVIDELVAGTQKIVYTKGREKNTETFNAESKGILEQGKVVVLVDEGSASAAEIVSGALQDYDRATIIGRRTFGKGLVQEQYPLSNGGALRLTVARYYIPSGRCIQKDYSHGKDNYEKDLQTRYLRGELASQDSVNYKDTTVYKTMAGRRVYGGGGIMPDIFVPIIDNKYSTNLREVLGTGYLTEVVNDYYLANKPIFQKFASVEDFIKMYAVDKIILQAIQQKCKSDKISVTSFSTKADVVFLQSKIKSQLAKLLFGSSAQYQVFNAEDLMLKIALQEISK
jgi:carboxyl-terminal processing protease